MATNWQQVRDRLRTSEEALEKALDWSPERIEAAFRRRAARLANRVSDRGPVSACVPVMVFRLAQERYAIELSELAEALPFARCTRVPGTPPQFAGVINLRGELRAVVNLGHLLLGPAGASGDSGFVLMLRRPGREIGLKVDRIEELAEFRPGELALPAQRDFVKGVASGTLMLLSVDAVLAQIFSKEES